MDTVVEPPNSPNYIKDFRSGEDTIGIDVEQVDSFSDLNLVRRRRNTHIRLGTDTIAIVRSNRTLDEEDFIFTHHEDVTAPILEYGLLNDTGKSAEDGVTSDGTVVGKVTDDGEIVSLTAQFSSNEIEIELKEDGTFSLNHQDLEQLYGSNLADGRRSFTLWAEDAAGNISEQTISFVLDTTPADISLDLKNDTGADSTDTVTTDPSLVVSVTDSSQIVSIKAGFGGTPLESFTELTAFVQADGSFSLNQEQLEDINGGSLKEREYVLTLLVEDVAGNISDRTRSFVLDTVGPVAALNLRDDTGADSTDTVTTDPSLVVSVTDSSQIVSIQAGFGTTPLESFTELTAFVQADGSFSLNREQLEDINGGGFVDGNHSLTILAEDEAGNLSENTISFLLDTVAPTASIANSLNTTDTVIEVNYSEAVSEIATENYILIFGEEEIPLERVTEIDSTTHQLHLAAPLDAGEYQLTITGVTDVAGNLVEETAALEFTVIGAPVSISPRSGSEMVSLTREVVVNFGKKVDPATVNENTFTVIAQGRSSTRKNCSIQYTKICHLFPRFTSTSIHLSKSDPRWESGNGFGWSSSRCRWKRDCWWNPDTEL